MTYTICSADNCHPLILDQIFKAFVATVPGIDHELGEYSVLCSLVAVYSVSTL